MLMAEQETLRVGFAGAGYIADWHAQALAAIPTAELVAVCDPSVEAAERLAATSGVTETFRDLATMLKRADLDVVHVLAPPECHYHLASQALQSAVHVYLEKPMCVSKAEAHGLIRMAEQHKRALGVAHNFTFYDPYVRLRDDVHCGRLGQLDQVRLTWHFELPQVRSGPFDAWMLRQSGNIMLEIGPHPVSVLLDLVGMPAEWHVVVSRPVDLPNGRPFYRRWQALTEVNNTAVDLSFSFGPGMADRAIHLRGSLGRAQLDYDANTYWLDRRSTLPDDFDRYTRTRRAASSMTRQSRATLRDCVMSKFRLTKRGNPYGISICNAARAFYQAVADGSPQDDRLCGATGVDVLSCCQAIVERSGVRDAEAAPQSMAKTRGDPTVLVTGGTGFIGRVLVRRLAEAGHVVRVVTRRNRVGLPNTHGRVQYMRGDLRRPDDIRNALVGIDAVFHLARGDGKTRSDFRSTGIEPTRRLVEACLSQGIRRLIYTGTIDSYYAGDGARKITEDTPSDPHIDRRNNYAWTKATEERMLLRMYRDYGLPVVIVRPGIVIGQGGTPFHWGVGMWHDPGVCQLWGNGDNPLPFVLVGDVADAMVKTMLTDGIEGRSYNLVDTPLLSARDYLAVFEECTCWELQKRSTPIWRFYAVDMVKWIAKAILRHPGRDRVPSYRDWQSRTQRAEFDCSRARRELDWQPCSDKQHMIDLGIIVPGMEMMSWSLC